jgi:hypothetical protein
MPSFVARTHQARSALLCGTKHFGVPSVSPDSSLIPPSGSNLTRQLVSELCPQLGYCVGLLIPPWQSHVHSAARHMHRDEFLQHQRRLRQRVSFAQFWWYGSLSVRCGIRDKRVGTPFAHALKCGMQSQLATCTSCLSSVEHTGGGPADVPR